MNFQDLRSIIGQIKKNVRCPKCKMTYTDKDIEIIGSPTDNHAFFHAKCLKCKAEAVINVSIEHDGAQAGIPELKFLANNVKQDQVTINEVLDIRNFLNSFDGNFSDLFKAPQS